MALREALSRGDDAARLAAILRMGDTQRADSRWQYLKHACASARVRSRRPGSCIRSRRKVLRSMAGWPQIG